MSSRSQSSSLFSRCNIAVVNLGLFVLFGDVICFGVWCGVPCRKAALAKPNTSVVVAWKDNVSIVHEVKSHACTPKMVCVVSPQTRFYLFKFGIFEYTVRQIDR